MKADEGRESDPDPHREGQGGALGGVVRVQEPPGEDARSFLRDPHWVFVPAEAPGRGAPKSVNVSWEACRAQQVASRGNGSVSRLSHGPSRRGFTAGGDGAGSGRTRGEAGGGGHPPRHRGPSRAREKRPCRSR